MFDNDVNKDINYQKGQIMGAGFSIMDSLGVNDPMSAFVFGNMQQQLENLDNKENTNETLF